MTKTKRIMSITLLIVMLVAMLSFLSVNSYAATTRNYVATVNDYRGHLNPQWNNTLTLSGKKTYTIQAIGTNVRLSSAATNADVKAAVNKMRFDVTIINANGTKSTYYGVKHGFKFNLPKNRTYKVYITSYLTGYKNTYYGVKTGALVQSLFYNLKY